MSRWVDETDETDLALALGLECADCGRFSGPHPRGWTTCAIPATTDGPDAVDPVLFFCPICAKRRLD